MNPSAHVHSLDALRDMRAALVKFREEASHALTSIEVEIRRTLDWLGHDELKRWQHELRQREEALGEAKAALARCQLMKNPGGETPSCYDEKKQLARAKHRVEEAEEKLKLIKKWTQIVEQEVIEYHGPAQQLDHFLQQELSRGIEDLESRVASLEAYLDMAAGGETGVHGGAPSPSNTPSEPT